MRLLVMKVLRVVRLVISLYFGSECSLALPPNNRHGRNILFITWKNSSSGRFFPLEATTLAGSWHIRNNLLVSLSRYTP